ncbi:hypothetical protein TRIATDRAFT_33283 [Trichoderma atroviride IMI 206040]|uniref:NmrA-like domain-containing protein n=1 Tax=Hypocrea atroviridis (strain ATCC 20476 / IMI 206040) TaxID=452589 RepID=G9P0K7_HYPAI|nr:uncharacterized protein TRIATDRAFT_33283 [Trichoderma atroviride IMI 206040]EHK42378.1 hypothetical protein TRIATDRAFT_33283 [Trichoderma atroviride IMI 206040]
MAPVTVAVVGATGSQGGAVVAELLKYPERYRVRGLTRDVNKPAAQLLSAKGVEVVSADLSAGSNALIGAFAGASVIFGLTDFWASCSSAIEVQQGRNLVDAAAATATLTHFVWSALPDPVALSHGKYLHVHHWKGKSEVTEYINATYPALWEKTTTVLFPNYFENCLTNPASYLPKNVSGTYVHSFLHSPTTVLPNVSIADTGKLVRAVIEDGQQYFTKTIAFYAQSLSEAEKVKVLGEVLNVPTKYTQISPEEFQQGLIETVSMTEEDALDFTEQLLIFETFGNVYARDEFIQAADIPGLSLTTWKEFIQGHDLLGKMNHPN